MFKDIPQNDHLDMQLFWNKQCRIFLKFLLEAEKSLQSEALNDALKLVSEKFKRKSKDRKFKSKPCITIGRRKIIKDHRYGQIILKKMFKLDYLFRNGEEIFD